MFARYRSRLLERLPRFNPSLFPAGLILLAASLLLIRMVLAERNDLRLIRLEGGLQTQSEMTALVRGVVFQGLSPTQRRAMGDLLSVNLSTLQDLAEVEERLALPIMALTAAIQGSEGEPPSRVSNPFSGLQRPSFPFLPVMQPDPLTTALHETGVTLRGEIQALRNWDQYAWRVWIMLSLGLGGCGISLLLMQRRDTMRGAERQVAVATAQLRAVYAAAPIGLLLLDGDMRILRANPSFVAMAKMEGTLPEGTQLGQVMPGLARLLAPLLQETLLAGQAMPGRELVVETPAGVMQQHYFVTAEPVVGIEGPPLTSLVVVDVTDRVAAEAWRTEVVAELNHRVKNTLATVQSLAAQTLRGAGHDPQRFAADFSARLGALSRSHELIAADGWTGTSVEQAAQAALTPWLSSGRMALCGPARVLLRAAQVQALMIALGELAGNAARHGALSAGGRVRLSWTIEPEGLISLTWSEIGGPPLPGPPARRGFGLRFLERGLVHDLGREARVKFQFEPTGLVYQVTFRPHALPPQDQHCQVVIRA